MVDKKEQGFRHELKFIISRNQGQILRNSLSGIMPLDPHMKSASYNVRSMYFDDVYHTCFFENESGTDPREKFRIRIYDCDDRFIRLELKMKSCGMTKKLQGALSRQQVDTILSGVPLPDFDQLPTLLKKFELQRLCRLLKPDIIVDYDRIPYVYELGNVRITFDTNIASSHHFDRFFEPTMPKRPILQQDMILMEVKYDELLPEAIQSLISPYTTHRSSFSKFYLCKKYQ